MNVVLSWWRVAPILSMLCLLVACQVLQGLPASNGGCTPTATPCPDATWNPMLGPRPVPTATSLDVAGSLIFPRRNALVSLNMQTRAITTVVEFAKNASLSTPASSADLKY